MFIFIALIKYHTGVLASKAMPVKCNFFYQNRIQNEKECLVIAVL